jgi:hypothetical protein
MWRDGVGSAAATQALVNPWCKARRAKPEGATQCIDRASRFGAMKMGYEVQYIFQGCFF